MLEKVGLSRRRKFVLISLSTAFVASIIGILLLGQTTPQAPIAEAPNQETPTDEIPDIEIPENTFVVPEVPYGTIGILLAMLSALLIAHKGSKKKPLQTQVRTA